MSEKMGFILDASYYTVSLCGSYSQKIIYINCKQKYAFGYDLKF